MNFLASRALGAQLAVAAAVTGLLDRTRKDETGQGSVEYVGIIVVVVAIVLVIIGAATGIGETLLEKLQEQIDKLTT